MHRFSPSRRRLLLAVPAAAALAGPASVLAQSYPSRPVTILVPAAAGGPADTMTRGLAEQLASRLGQPVVVENAPGASGAVAAQRLLKAAPDGHTLMFGITSEMIVTPLVVATAGYATRDFTPVALIGSTPLTLVAGNHLGIKDVDQLIALSRQRPNGVSLGASGATSLGAFAAASLAKTAGLDYTLVPFGGDSAVVPQVIGGHVDIAVLAMPAALPLARSGKVSLLGLLTAERSPLAPELPTVNESRSVKGLNIEIWGGIVGPGRLPTPIVDKLNAAVQDIARDPKFLEWRLARFDRPAAPAPASDFARFLAQEESKFRGLLSGMKLQ